MNIVSRAGSCRTLLFTVCAVLATCAVIPSVAVSQDKLSKFLLIKLSREQSTVLCQSTVFTQCMAFTKDECLALSEKALQECIVPMPDTINLEELQNDDLEACPKRVYDEAGYSDEKAQQCLQEALK